MKMIKYIVLVLSSISVFADPGIMIDIDIVIHGPSGKGEPEMGVICK